LLVVPFNVRFLEVTDFQQAVYLVTLLLTAASSAFLIAPTVHHRLTFRQQQKERIVLVGNRLTIVGLTTLGLAMTGVVLLVTDFVFGTVATVVGAGLTAALFAVVWYVVPLRRQV
jgi:putative flippase GtrA